MAGGKIASVEKTLEILNLLAFEDITHAGMRLSEMAERLGQKPGTLHGILKTMVECGYVERGEHARYRTGKRCDQIGVVNRFRMHPQTAQALNDRLRELCDQSGESVSFYVLSGGARINYANYQTRDIVKVEYTMLEKNNLYEYPSGRILVAYCAPWELEQVLGRNGYPKNAWGGIVNRSQLDAEIARVRGQGLLIRHTQTVASYAVPVFGADGTLLGSAGIYLPELRSTAESEARFCALLRAFSGEPF